LIHHVSRIPLNSKGEATLFVFGDKQAGGSGYAAEMWKEFELQFKAAPNAWALGLGDYGDWLRPSMRERLYATLSKDDGARQQLDNMVIKDHDGIIDEMEFMKGRLVGIHEGHHTHYFLNGGNTDQRLASALKAPFLGWSASTRLVLTMGVQKEGQGTHAHVYTMLSTHGSANSPKVGGSANWMEDKMVGAWSAEHYIMGHGCKNANFVPHERNEIRRVGPAGIKTVLPRCMIVGGFSRGYTDGWKSSYVERQNMKPQPIGWGIIRFKAVRRRAQLIAQGLGDGRSTNLSPKTLAVEQVTVTPDAEQEP